MRKNILKNIVIAAAAFLVVLFGLNGLYTTMLHGIIRESKDRYYYIGVNEVNELGGSLERIIVRTFVLRDMVQQENGGTGFFGSMAPIVYGASASGGTGQTIRNIALAPGGIISDVYPAEGGGELLGHDYSSEPGDAMAANREGKTVITGIGSMGQNGMLMAVRTPVYIDGGFWGIVSAYMDFGKVLEVFNLGALEGIGVDYRLSARSGEGETVLAQFGENFANAVSVPFSAYNLDCTLELVPRSGWYDFGMIMLGRGIVLFTSLIVMGLAISFTKIRGDSHMMRTMAETDVLTGCHSRYYMGASILSEDASSWKNPDESYSVAIVDVDRFKSINDTFGHAAGDMALVLIADVIMGCVDGRKGDRVVRFGGDEFLVFLRSPDVESLRRSVWDMVSAVSYIKVESFPEMVLSISVGGAFNSGGGEYLSLMKRADENLYTVKGHGRNGGLVS